MTESVSSELDSKRPKAAITCPTCGSPKTRVYYTRPADGCVIQRLHIYQACGRRIATRELVIRTRIEERGNRGR